MKKILVIFILSALSCIAVSGQTIEELQQLKLLQSQLGSVDQAKMLANKTTAQQEPERTRAVQVIDTIPTSPKQNISTNTDNSVYGRSIFSRKNISFAPSMNIPTPVNYILAAGDQVIIDIWGDTQESISRKISPDGSINIPGVGPIQLSGLTINQAESTIRSRISQTVESISYGGTNLKISLGDIRSIQVNIIGEAAVPGSYTLPSLASLFNAIYAAGGVSSIGSLREIKLFRKGKEIASLDVYEYLLHGKQSVDMRLNDNDLIVISPYKNIVKIAGKIKRPHNYELKPGQTLAELIAIAGDFTGDAHTEIVNVVRKSGKQYQIYTVAKDQFATFSLHDKDEVSIMEVSKEFANRISISGAIWRGGNYQLSDKIATVKDLITAAGGLKDEAYTGRANIFRIRPDKTREMVSVNLKEIVNGTQPDVMLQNNDSLRVESVANLRGNQTIRVLGEVNNGAELIFPYYEGMTIEDVILMSGGLKESASRSRLEVSRRIKDPMSMEVSERRAEIFGYQIPEDLKLDKTASKFELEPFDEIFIRRSPGYTVQEHAVISGQVQFPGEYTFLKDDEKISDLLLKSGGVTKYAYIKGASLQRRITKSDLERIKSVNKLVNKDRFTLSDTILVDMLKVGDYYSVGIDLESALKNPNGHDDITLRAGDVLNIPTYNNTVKISGAVYYAATTTYSPKLRLNDYISQAGGFAKGARKSKVFVIYMNGKVAASRFMGNLKIEPGCEIIVPQKPEGRKSSPSEVIGMSTSLVSMMALIGSLIK